VNAYSRSCVGDFETDLQKKYQCLTPGDDSFTLFVYIAGPFGGWA
jgi:hypothetical protein